MSEHTAPNPLLHPQLSAMTTAALQRAKHAAASVVDRQAIALELVRRGLPVPATPPPKDGANG